MAKAKKKRKRKATPEEIEKRKYRNEVRGIFIKAGFTRVPQVSDKEFHFQKKYKSDFDDVFVLENIVVFTEYTLTKSSEIGTHLKTKSIVYNAIVQNSSAFLDYFGELFPAFQKCLSSLYDNTQMGIVILYCAKNDIDPSHKAIINGVKYFDYPILRYFRSISDAIRNSSKYELLKFFGIEYSEFGANVLSSTEHKKSINGTILPETNTNFKSGYKVVSFYIDPLTMLTNSYVLRKDGWRDESNLYQRMIVKSKISAIRKYLLKEKRVFINNIIVTLPAETILLGSNGKAIDISSLNKTAHVKIQIPDEFNVIGLIDGQHRVFAYHEGGEKDKEIGVLRVKQNLLATGIVYPEKVSDNEKAKFEANLFLEINANQTNAKSDLKQAIALILNPFGSESIAYAVIRKLNEQGALANMFQKYFYENDRIKTTSIVSYGIRPLIKLSGEDSAFSAWKYTKKNSLVNGKDEQLLNAYVDFCVNLLNVFLGALKSELKSGWTIDKNEPNHLLSTTTINGFVVCLRLIILNKQTTDFEGYRKKITGISTFPFTDYKSSQYGALGRDLYDRFFKT